MLYHLFKWLNANYDLPGSGMFEYLTFRAGFAFVIALIVSTIIGKHIINALNRNMIKDEIRDLGLPGQEEKKNTPTMGGIIIILSILVGTLLFADLTNVYIILMIITTLWLGLLGFRDDYIKVFKKNKAGLKGKSKIVGQVSIGLIVGLTLYLSPDATMVENVSKEVNSPTHSEVVDNSSREVKSTKTTIPFVKSHNLDYADAFTWAGPYKQQLGWILFVIVAIFVVTAVSNGANLNDGMDGLATGSSAIQGATLGILAYLSGNIRYSAYLDIMYVPGSGELMVFAAAFIGATLGFLFYNSYPAEVFMGDTGSLTLGGIIAVMALALHKELLLPILSGVFLVEVLSDIIQVWYFRHSGRTMRVFKKAPLHHHFEKPAGEVKALIQKPYKAIHEAKITMYFWLAGLILAALTLITLKIR